MTDSIDTETILKEILNTLNRHSLPVKSMKLDISLSIHDFEIIFPEIRDYKAGHFSKHNVIDDIPVTFQAQRRIPFNEIVKWLEANALQFVKDTANEIEQEFAEIKSHFQIQQYENDPRYASEKFYSLGIECRLRSEPKIKDGNTVVMTIGVRQYDSTSYPIIFGHVGWLYDEEGEGDWGIETVIKLNQLELSVNETSLENNKQKLTLLSNYLFWEIETLVKTEPNES